jgi:hypothetical protein
MSTCKYLVKKDNCFGLCEKTNFVLPKFLFDSTIFEGTLMLFLEKPCTQMKDMDIYTMKNLNFLLKKPF